MSERKIVMKVSEAITLLSGHKATTAELTKKRYDIIKRKYNLTEQDVIKIIKKLREGKWKIKYS